MKPHRQTPTLPRTCLICWERHCFYPLETFSLKLEKVRFLVTQGSEPQAAGLPQFKTETPRQHCPAWGWWGIYPES